MRFIARTAGRACAVAVLAAAVVIGASGCTAPSPAPTPVASASPTPPTIDDKTSTELFPGGPFLDPRSDAVVAEDALVAAGDTATAKKIAKISSQPTAIWLGEWITVAQMPAVLSTYVAEAKAAKTTLVFVIYAIPNRDCGDYSAGGLTPETYPGWISAVTAQLRGTGAVMIVEPDSLSMLPNAKCAGESERRLPLIKNAVETFAAAGLVPYLDAGNNNWLPEKRMAKLLTEAGVADARGFFTNVSNFYRVDEERSYANALSKLLGGKHFVIDVSRNGNGWKGDWCNPTGAALGQTPRVATGTTKLDALLWIKHPGESDGTCNGGPNAGKWWPSYALDLVNNGADK